MPFCPNPECPHKKSLGEPAEFIKGVTTCTNCGAPLIRYLYKTIEDELIDLSIEIPVQELSHLATIFRSVGIPYPNCWIGIRIKSDFIKKQLPLKKLNDIPSKYRIPGNFDIIGGSLVDEMPSDYIVGFEVKRFRYIAGNLKDPDSFGTSQAKGYSLFGFNKVMLCHIVVAQPLNLPNYNDWFLNNSIVLDGMEKLQKRKIGINDETFFGCGYSILGWAQVSHKDPHEAGGLPSFIVKHAKENPFSRDVLFQDARNALISHTRSLYKQKMSNRTANSRPIIVALDS
jgi:hypothetical protein